MKRMLWKRFFAALLAVCLMVATTATGAFALGTRTKSVTRIAENTAASAGFDLSAYAEKLTDLLNVPMTGDVAADVGTLLTNAKLYNVLIVGVDSRQNDYAGRSDAMMVLTVNPLSQKLVMTSLLRDSYVDIPGHGQERLNEAYNYGGASLLKKTILQNYGIKIDAFMVVNFGDLIEFVDDIGGVEMTVTKKEVPVKTGPEGKTRTTHRRGRFDRRFDRSAPSLRGYIPQSAGKPYQLLQPQPNT